MVSVGWARWLTPVIPALWEAEVWWITRSRDRDHPGQHGETLSLLKIQKMSWAQWRVPVIPATREAEAGELPEPRRRRLRWAEIVPLPSSLDNKSKTPLSQKKKKDLNNQCNKKEIKWKIMKYSKLKKKKTNHIKIFTESVLRRKFIALNIYPRKYERSQTNKLSFHLKNLNKQLNP